MYRVLIIEDDTMISSILVEHLGKWGYEVRTASEFADILPEYSAFSPHLLLMDINLPYYDGFYWCAKVRELSNAPILFISSRDSDGDKIRAITQGGDDYIEKPFSVDLLTAKISAILRRAYSSADQTLNVLQYRDLILNVERLQAFCREAEIELTRNECRILTLLVRNSGNLVTRSRLMQALWGRKLCGRQYPHGERQPPAQKTGGNRPRGLYKNSERGGIPANMKIIDYVKERWIPLGFIFLAFLFAFLVYRLDSGFSIRASNASYILMGWGLLFAAYLVIDGYTSNSRARKFRNFCRLNGTSEEAEEFFYPSDRANAELVREMAEEYENTGPGSKQNPQKRWIS